MVHLYDLICWKKKESRMFYILRQTIKKNIKVPQLPNNAQYATLISAISHPPSPSTMMHLNLGSEALLIFGFNS